MALLKCPECKKKFSDKAAACPSCGSPVSAALEAKNRDGKNAKIGYVLIAVIVAVMALASGGDKKDVPPVTAPAAQTEEEKIASYLARLDAEIAAMASIKPDSYKEDFGAINTGLILIGAWALLYEQGGDLNLDEAGAKKRAAFRRAVVGKQSEILPAMRDAYGPAMRKQLWEADGSAKTFGAGFRTVEFVSAAFARNANIKKINGQVHETLLMLRFNRAQYKWFSAADRYTYYDLKPPKDTDLVKWGASGRFEILK